MVYVTKVVVNSIVGAINSDRTWTDVREPLMLIGLAISLMVVAEVLRSIMDWVRTGQAEFIQDHIVGLLHQQSAAVDLSFYENAEYYDRLEQARGEASARSQALLENIGGLAQNAVTLCAMSLILLPYGTWIPLLLLLSTLPALYVVLRFDRRYHEWWKQRTPDRRRAQYYDLMLTNSAPAAEVRLFGLGAYFQSAYRDVRSSLRHERLRLQRTQSLARLGAGAAALLGTGLAMSWMIWRAIHGLVTLGDLALFYQAFNRGQDLMRSLLGSVGQIYSNSRFLGNLFAFLELQPQISSSPDAVPAPVSLKNGIAFRQVTFRYPGNERIALQNFNLTLPAGKIVAIVGMNGAGKTTLVKLLCRFYDPEAGTVEFDGVDIRTMSVAELRRRITVLFQFPMPYQTSAAENIALGDVERDVSEDELEAAARSAGAHDLIARLPNRYDTQLGKWFGNGVELSGGEWQRIAMARAYLRQSPVLVLDEPTSAMDSWAEADWFERLRSLATGRTGLIITHRFTIAMRADIIHVMEQGQIIESGSHDELLALGGRYAESWEAQMRASTTGTQPVDQLVEQA